MERRAWKNGNNYLIGKEKWGHLKNLSIIQETGGRRNEKAVLRPLKRQDVLTNEDHFIANDVWRNHLQWTKVQFDDCNRKRL